VTARALRLSEDERVYLFDLARQRPRDRAPSATAAESLNRLVADLSPRPAMVIDHRFDILAWNDKIAALLLDFDRLPPGERNVAWLCVAHPEFRDFYADRERIVRESIADLRAAWAAHSDDKALDDLIAKMKTASPEFARLWRQHDVRVNGRGLKRLLHPVAGRSRLSSRCSSQSRTPTSGWSSTGRPTRCRHSAWSRSRGACPSE